MSGDSLVERLRAQRERHLERSRIVRVGFVIGGFTVLLAGVAMLVLPGPGFIVIAVALAILSLEFAWAGRLLEKALVHAERARESARRTSRAERVAVAVAVGLAVAAFVVAAVLWDIPLLPV
jgi:uncharacterized protein (TIGR02611 family)